MDYGVNYSGNGEDAAHNGANIDNEFEKVLRELLILDSDGRQLVVEHQNVLLRVVISDRILSELVHLVLAATGICEVRWHCD